MQKAPETPTFTATQADMEKVIAAGPAIYASRVFISTAGEGFFRLTFVEQMAPDLPMRFRTAVLVSQGLLDEIARMSAQLKQAT